MTSIAENIIYKEAGTVVQGKIPAITIDNMDDPLIKSYQWYNRMGLPTRKDMKERLVKMNITDISISDVDLLPWNESCSTTFNWETEDAELKRRELEEEERELKRKEEKLQQLLKKKKEAERLEKEAFLLERLKKKQEENKKKKQKEKKSAAKAKAKAADEERKKKLKEAEEEAERKRLQEEQEEAERRRLQEEEAAAEAERKRLREEKKEAERRRRLKKKEEQAERKRLQKEKEEAERKRVEQEEEERKRLQEEAEKVEAERERLLLEQADQSNINSSSSDSSSSIGGEDDDTERLRREKSLEYPAKKSAKNKAKDLQTKHLEQMLKEKVDLRQMVEKLENEKEYRELTEEELKLIKQYYETRRLLAYKWWGRLNRPSKKKYNKLIVTIPDMRFSDLKGNDIDLLPWISDDFYVNVPQMSIWLGTLDPYVIETVARWM